MPYCKTKFPYPWTIDLTNLVLTSAVLFKKDFFNRTALEMAKNKRLNLRQAESATPILKVYEDICILLQERTNNSKLVRQLSEPQYSEYENLKKTLDKKVDYLYNKGFHEAARVLFKLSEVIYNHQHAISYTSSCGEAFETNFKNALQNVNNNATAMNQINTQRGVKSFIAWLVTRFGGSTQLTPENKNKFFTLRTDTSKLLETLNTKFEHS